VARAEVREGENDHRRDRFAPSRWLRQMTKLATAKTASPSAAYKPTVRCHGRLGLLLKRDRFLCRRPSVKLRLKRVNGTLPRVLVAVNRQSFALFPKLDGPDLAAQIGSDLLPRIQTPVSYHGSSV
jgi:hypothetical protein